MSDKSAKCDRATEASRFYDDRYERGYMEHWPARTTARIRALIESLGLPETGIALDFGCGNGVFTEVLVKALPGWKVFGTDLSIIAVQHAEIRVPSCSFFVAARASEMKEQFDLVFSHHVLEHVQDVNEAVDEIVAYLKPGGFAFTVLPCGNNGSFERSICALRSDGTDAAMGNRFFYEDPGHLRRLTSTDLVQVFRDRGFLLTSEFYSNHRLGALEWLTESAAPLTIFRLTGTERAVTASAAKRLRALRASLLLMWALRFPACRVHTFIERPRRTFAHVFVFLSCLPLLPFSEPIDRYIRKKAEHEWQTRKSEPAGSIMYLFFQRAHDVPPSLSPSAPSPVQGSLSNPA